MTGWMLIFVKELLNVVLVVIVVVISIFVKLGLMIYLYYSLNYYYSPSLMDGKAKISKLVNCCYYCYNYNYRLGALRKAMS